jgi:hypothetical protein
MERPANAKAYADEAGVSLDDLVDDGANLPGKLPAAKRKRALNS